MSQWYSVKEYEPRVGNKYLVPYGLDFYVANADWGEEGYFFIRPNGVTLKNITHFMPIPPVPKDVK